MERLRVLTWHVHGTYLRALAEVPVDWYLPVRPGRPPGAAGRTPTFDWPDNVHEVAAEEVRATPFDVVLHQSRLDWEVDRVELLSPAQRRLPTIVVEHDPPRASPTETRHPVDDPDVLLVHVTHFNDLMWESGATPTRVIEHGIIDRGARWTGDLGRGLTVVNGIARRGRRTGADVHARIAAAVPLDLRGMWSEEVGGLGEVRPPAALAGAMAPYRFLCNPIRWTSLGMTVCEAMLVGLPILGLATTAMPEVIRDGEAGYLANDVEVLIAHAQRLLRDRDEAAALSATAHRIARERFGIGRFVRDWSDALALVTARTVGRAGAMPTGPSAAVARA